ncbi:MAG: putative viral replication protein [Cressdnaviricota sp.]|nr:MAG: putative viral replication protein [Cressdnaviricota sp.]
MAPAQRYRGYCFTINNPTQEDIEKLKKAHFKYIIYGREIGESGTLHLQGYIHYINLVDLRRVKLDMPRAHIEVRKGTLEEAITYCKKDGLFEEHGTKPLTPSEKGQMGKEAWRNIIEKAKAGDLEWIEENEPKTYFVFSDKIQRLYEPKTSILPGVLQHEWWVGPTGVGKSRLLWQLYPNHYQKELNKWWCGYSHEDIVAIEEWSPTNECTGSQLKIWADRYPFTGQVKGSSLKKIRPTKLIVLSNYTIEECFQNHKDLKPILRRFTQLRFPEDEQTAIDRWASHMQTLSDAPIMDPIQLPVPQNADSVPICNLPDLDLDSLLNFDTPAIAPGWNLPDLPDLNFDSY